MKLVLYGSPVLREKCKDIDLSNKRKIRDISDKMIDIMYNHDGIGLAGPQVALNQNIFVVETGDGPLTIVNPEIVYKSKEQDQMSEGCLSLPGTQVKVKRPKEVKVKAYLVQRDKHIEIKGTGLLSKSLQHEYDHLQGRLIIDYLPFWKRKKEIKKLEERVKQE